MLTHLRIKNLALVADLSVEFQPGFNAVTGETGAGKSILIGALNLLLGQRADRTLLRAGADACTVEAVFDVRRVRAPIAPLLEESGLEPVEDGQLVLKRTLTASGGNRQFVNGSPATLQTLATLGDWLVDIHGPHDHQSLFQPARQLDLLDAFAGLESLRDSLAARFDHRNRIAAELAAIDSDEQSRARELDLLRHQIAEIETARLQPGEEETVEAEHHRARNAARLLELAHEALGGLSESEDALLTVAGRVGRTLHELARLDPAAASWTTLHEQAVDTLRELQSALSTYADRVDLDPARLRELEERVDLLHSLRRKYGGSVADVIAFGAEARARANRLENAAQSRTQLEAERETAERELRQTGQELAAARRRAAPKLVRAVTAQLRDLGFKRSEFAVDFRTLDAANRSGFDAVEFQFAPNPGEPARALRAIASSGELARVMLALKTVLAAQDDVPLLVFDEVDANIGGETAHAVGQKMRQIGQRRQVLCITHLAPVAAAGASHLVVAKTVREGRTLTELAPVQGAERAAELARMLGGGAAARTHAEALLAGSTT